MRRCRACDSLISADRLLCHPCWRSLPDEIRDRLSPSRRGSPSYDAAVREAATFFAQRRTRTGRQAV